MSLQPRQDLAMSSDMPGLPASISARIVWPPMCTLPMAYLASVGAGGDSAVGGGGNPGVLS